MKRLLQFGFLLGFLATAAAAYFLPWLGYERYPSATAAVMNGGRSEQFLVRLPNDRIYAAASGMTTPASPVVTPLSAAAGLGENAATAVEHYKVRDVNGNVIGVAARHATTTPEGNATAWMLSLPSRGTIVFGGAGGAIGQIDSALGERGWTPGQALSAEFSVARTAGLPSVHGTREFDGIDFTLDETWQVTGVDDEGQLRGTIALDTVGRRLQ